MPSLFQAKENGQLTHVFDCWYSTSFEAIRQRISNETEKLNGKVEETTIVGFSASEAGLIAKNHLEMGRPWAVEFGQRHM